MSKDEEVRSRGNGQRPTLVIYGSDAPLINRLKAEFASLSYVRCEVGYGPVVTKTVGLDAFWVTLMAAVELYGATPPFPLHVARVVKTPEEQLKKGFPKHGVIGVAMSEQDDRSPEAELRLVVSALLQATDSFNRQGGDQISKVGLLPEDLGLTRMKSNEARGIIRELYES